MQGDRTMPSGEPSEVQRTYIRELVVVDDSIDLRQIAD